MSFIKNAAIILSGRVVSILVGLVSVMVLPRILVPQDMGFYAYWFSIVALIEIAISFGTSSTIDRLIPQFLVESPGVVRPFLRKVLLTRGIVAIIVFAGTLVVSPQPIWFGIAIAGAFILTIANGIASYFYSIKEMGKFVSSSTIHGISRIVLLLVLPVFFGKNGIFAAVVLYGAAYSLLLAVPFLKSFSHLPKDEPLHFRPVLGYGLLLCAGATAIALVARAFIPAAHHVYADITAIGYLSFAFILIIQTLRLLPESFALSVYHDMIQSLARTESVQMQRDIFERGYRALNILLFPLVGGCAFTINSGILYLAGSRYNGSAVYCLYLLPAMVFMNWSLLGRYYLMASNKTVDLLVHSVVSAVAAGISLVFFVPRFGLVAAPLCLAGFFALLWCLSFIHTKKLYSQQLLVSAFVKPLIATTVMVVALWFFPQGSPVLLIGEILLGIVVYSGVLFVIQGIPREITERLPFGMRGRISNG